MNQVLQEMDNLIEWEGFFDLLEPARGSDGGGGLDFDPVILIKLLFLQRLFQLSDAGVIEEAGDRLSFKQFLGLKLEDPLPKESDLVEFRRLLRQHDVWEPLKEALEQPLSEAGIMIESGWIKITDLKLVRDSALARIAAKEKKPPPQKPETHALDPDAAFWLQMGKIEQIKGYKLEHALAAGSVASVFKGTEIATGRPVAIKVILPSKASEETLERFVQETQLMSELEHPGIAKIYDSGAFESETGQRPFLVMEYIKGKNISEFSTQNKLNVRQKIALIAKLCDAIHYVHMRDIIHRDLKPANILVDEKRQPKVLDFGLARVSSGVRAARHQTSTGQILGTLDFMSPEQAAGKPSEIDSRVDIYAIGAIGYMLLTGNAPLDLRFKGVVDALRIITTVPPKRLGTIDPALEGDVESIFAKALAKDKNDRYETAADFYKDLIRFLKNTKSEEK